MHITAKARYSVLDQNRQGVLMRARQASAITIPSILPPEGHTEDAPLKTPYQALGARGVNNLASKMLLALLPSSTSFFRLRLSEEVAEQLGESKADVEDAMRTLENRGLLKIEQSNLRVMAHSAIKHMIVTGNSLLYMPKTMANRMYRLSQFVVKRDPAGTVMEIIIKESVNKDTLDPEICKACDLEDQTHGDGKDKGKVDLYTWVKLKDGKHVYHQELNEIKVPDSEGRAPAEESPFIVMRWSAIENEDYGRGMIEEYLGDLISLEGLSKSIIQFAAAAARIIFLLSPNSLTDEDELTTAESGDIVSGVEGDVSILQIEKNADFQAAKSVWDEISLRLSHAFLLRSGTVRDAERVTAEEIRSQAQELEDVLGGVYTVQAHEFQMPIVRRLLANMKAAGEYPSFGKDVITPSIVTGFEALGRGHELNKLREFYSDLANIFGPEIFGRFKDDIAIKQIANGHNVDVKDLLKTDEDLQAEQKQAQMAALADKAIGPVAGAMAKQESQPTEE